MEPVTPEGPASWGDISRLFNAGKLLRSPGVAKRYREFFSAAQELGITPEKSVLDGFFSLGIKEGEQNLPLCYCLFSSEYPYWIEDDVAHLLMFASQPIWDAEHLKQMAIKLLSKQIQTICNSQFEWIVLVNPTELRSIKGLGHAHIFLRDSSENDGISQLLDLLPKRKGIV